MGTLAADARSAEGSAGLDKELSAPVGVVLGIATGVTLLGGSLVLLLLPPYVHTALDYAGSAELLGLPRSEVHRLSDLTVAEVLFGPGGFDFSAAGSPAPFYDAAEASHLRDVRVVLWGFLATAVVCVLVLASAAARGRADPSVWRAIARGAGALGVTVAVVGIGALIAFQPLFTLFHTVFFPGGNWAFDPATQRLVQLYPTPFWQLTSAVLATLAVAAGLLVWRWAGRRADRLASRHGKHHR